MNDDDVALGYKVITERLLLPLRTDLNFSRSAMADLLETSLTTYTAWEERETTLWRRSAERLGRFYRHARAQLDSLARDGIYIADLVPLHEVAVVLGSPQELLLQRYRNDEFDAVDLGMLGLWIYREDLPDLRAMR